MPGAKGMRSRVCSEGRVGGNVVMPKGAMDIV